MKNYIQEGKIVTAIAPSGGVVAGLIYVVGALVLLASTTVAQDEEFEGETCGVFELPKTSADVPTQFQDAYWDAGANEVTVVVASNKKIGVFMKAYANGITLAQVRLNGVSV